MVDTSHANSNKQYQNQHIAFRDVIEQRCAGNLALAGLMVESNINEGNQKFPQPKESLKYGVSITDPCIGWEETESLLRWAHDRLS
jgi:3-deoxy-7-phosphoheptulonate synthase